MTLDELDSLLPNGFHDMYIGSLELDYSTGTIKLNVDLLVGWPEDSESERNQYQKAIVTITGLCFCSIDPPYPGYPLFPDGRAYMCWRRSSESRAPAVASRPPAEFPRRDLVLPLFRPRLECCIHVAARDAEVAWIGSKPQHAK